MLFSASGWNRCIWLSVISLCRQQDFNSCQLGSRRQKIKEGIEKISEGELDYKIDFEDIHGEQRKIAEQVNLSEADLMRQSRRI
ncbi:MAG: hypothetical protein ACLU80_11430 [Dorea sp.]